jgi:hypothetical protein
LVVGGQFVDNQQASFGEILNPLGEEGLNEEDDEGFLNEIEGALEKLRVA